MAFAGPWRHGAAPVRRCGRARRSANTSTKSLRRCWMDLLPAVAAASPVAVARSRGRAWALRGVGGLDGRSCRAAWRVRRAREHADIVQFAVEHVLWQGKAEAREAAAKAGGLRARRAAGRPGQGPAAARHRLPDFNRPMRRDWSTAQPSAKNQPRCRHRYRQRPGWRPSPPRRAGAPRVPLLRIDAGHPCRLPALCMQSVSSSLPGHRRVSSSPGRPRRRRSRRVEPGIARRC